MAQPLPVSVQRKMIVLHEAPLVQSASEKQIPVPPAPPTQWRSESSCPGLNRSGQLSQAESQPSPSGSSPSPRPFGGVGHSGSLQSLLMLAQNCRAPG